MQSVIGFKVQIREEGLKKDLLALNPLLRKRMRSNYFRNDKTFQCLHALESIQRGEKIDIFLAIRLAGQVAKCHVYKKFFNFLKSELELHTDWTLIDYKDVIRALPKKFATAVPRG